jgi:hypothetical protein
VTYEFAVTNLLRSFEALLLSIILSIYWSLLLELVQASRGVMGTDPGIDSLGPQAGPATEVPRARGVGKRTWANLGDPIGRCRSHVVLNT